MCKYLVNIDLFDKVIQTKSKRCWTRVNFIITISMFQVAIIYLPLRYGLKSPKASYQITNRLCIVAFNITPIIDENSMRFIRWHFKMLGRSLVIILQE